MITNLKRYGVLGLAALLLMNMVAGTWAYWTQTQQALNEFRTGKYSTELVENFVPPENWQPGENVSKDVRIKNDGTVPVFASISLSQEWMRRENVFDSSGKVVSPVAGEKFPITFAGENGEKYAALLQWGKDVVLLSSGKTNQPSLSLGLPIVSSVRDAQGKWLLVSETPDPDGKFTFYYIGVLEAGGETPLLLDGVDMNPDIEAVTLSENIVWDRSAKKWVKTTVENPTYDFQNAHYTLSVTMNTVQATADAMKEMFGSNKNSAQAVIACLESVSVLGKEVDYSRNDGVTEKKLYLTENNGTLAYTPASPGENWFMSHLNLLPGESYADTLQIENQTAGSYTLFMQAVPRNGYTDGMPKELLELIRMKVYDGDSLIYDGTALGRDYTGSIQNLQNVVALGKYASGAKSNLRVELQLDRNTPLKYADLLTQIDWKWMAEEEAIPVTPPKTGDSNHPAAYISFMAISGAAIAALLVLDKRRRKKERNK